MAHRPLTLWTAAVWCGGAVMGFELAGARLLMPAFGMGLDVWAAAISATLVALAAGYAAGGWLADARPSGTVLAAILLAAGCWLLALGGAGRRVVAATGGLPPAAGVWCSAVAVLVPPLVALGMVQPFLARLMLRATERTGKVVGGLLAAGTVGGVSGTVLTGLVLLPRLGLTVTLLTWGGGTMVAATALMLASRRVAAAAAGAVAAALVVGGAWCVGPPGVEAGPMRVLERVEGFYGELEVVEHRGTRMLLCNGIVQTAMPATGMGITRGTLLRGRDYTELIPYLRPGARKALVIGLGAGLHARMLATYGIETRCVEIDPEVVRLAAEHFGLAASVTTCDGRAFLKRRRRGAPFDAMVLDAFLGGTAPEHLFTVEAFTEMMWGLVHAGTDVSGTTVFSANGVLVVHLIGRPQHPAVRAVARTLGAVFPHTMAVRSGVADELQHIYLFASHQPLRVPHSGELAAHGFTGDEVCSVETEGAALLTDDRTCLALLSRDLVAEHRRQSLAVVRRPTW